MREEAIWLMIPLNPEPWAIGPVGVKRNAGKISAYVGRNQQLHAYEAGVADHVKRLWDGRPPLEGKVKLTFYFWRQRSEYKTAQSRTHRKHEADVTNLQKACEDAMQGIVFTNDRDNSDVRSVMVDQGEDVTPLILIKIEEYDAMAWAEEVDKEVIRHVLDYWSAPIARESDNTNGPPEGW